MSSRLQSTSPAKQNLRTSAPTRTCKSCSPTAASHWRPDGKPLFVTFHLHGSLPESQYPRGASSAGEAFVWIDRYLDRTQSGPLYLQRPDIAGIVVAQLRKGVSLNHYDLGAYVIMANHVHILIAPKFDPSRSLKMLKGSTAREANLLLGRTGEPFWQKESYDHWVRDRDEFERIRLYIENNPVKAGLVKTPREFPWSSAADSSRHYPSTEVDAAR